MFAGITINEVLPAVLAIIMAGIALIVFFAAEGQKAGWRELCGVPALVRPAWHENPKGSPRRQNWTFSQGHLLALREN